MKLTENCTLFAVTSLRTCALILVSVFFCNKHVFFELWMENVMNEIRTSTKLAIDWLIHSKIHNLSTANSEIFGSFNNYYDLIKRACPYAYTEITGYGIELLIDLYEKTNNYKYLGDAKLAAKWITNMQYVGKDRNAFGSFHWSLSLAKKQKSSRVYSFDAGVCIGALVELYKKTGDPTLLEAASKGAEWLISVMQNPDGSMKPFYDLRKGFSTSEKWYLPKGLRMRFSWFEKSGCYHCKTVIGLLKLHSVTGDDRFENASRKLCEWTISQQDSAGGFRVYSQSTSIFAHTHCYTIEGLMYASEYFGSENFSTPAKKAVLWLVTVQKLYECIPDWFHGRTPSLTVNSSSLAQAIRILIILKNLDRNNLHCDESTSAILKHLLTMQCTSSRDKHALGGFYLTEYNAKPLKIKLPRVYSWPTMFALQTFIFLNDKKIHGPLELW